MGNLSVETQLAASQPLYSLNCSRRNGLGATLHPAIPANHADSRGVNLTSKFFHQVLTGFADRKHSIAVTDKVQIPSHHAPYTRRWWRYEVNFPIRVIVRKVMKTTIVQGRAFSLSNGGMGMFAGAELRPEDEMCVEFTPPYSLPPLRVEVKIRNRSGYNYGIEFIADNNKQKEGVEQFCQHLSSLVAASADIG